MSLVTRRMRKHAYQLERRATDFPRKFCRATKFPSDRISCDTGILAGCRQRRRPDVLRLHLTRNLINPRRTIAARVTVVDQSVCLSFCLSVTTIPSWHRYCKITLKQPADNTRSDSTVRNRIAGYFATAL